MKRTNLLTKAFILVMALMGSVCSAWGDTYKFTITAEDFSGSSYPANNNEKTSMAVSTSDPSKTYEVKWTSYQVMKSSSTLQWQKNNGSIYNSTDLGTIIAVNISKGTGAVLTTYYGTSARPSSSTTVGNGYFQIKNGGKTSTSSKIEVTFKVPDPISYNLSVLSNNETLGTVKVSGNEITAMPKEGCRINPTTPYEVVSGTASIAQNGNVFTVTADADCTIRINFEAIPSHTATFYANGTVFATVNTLEGETVEFPVVEPAHVGNYEFKGWASSEVAKQSTAPEMVTTAIMSSENLEFYAVFAEKKVSEPVVTLTQTLEFDTWTYSGKTVNKNSYRLFAEGSYVESIEFDLSKLTKVVVYGGYYGATSSNKLSIGDGTNTWKDVTVSGNSQTKAHTYTGGNPLSGIGKLYVTSKSGNGSSTGVRMSKIEIYTMEPQITYTNFCTTLAEDITIGQLGYLTYSSANGLDFSDVAVKAYSVKYENGSAKLTEVETVPAGAGVVLKGAADTYSVKLTAEASAIENNDLKVSDGNVQGDGTVYCLANGSKGVGFYRVATTVTVPVGKCYLEIPAQSGEARQFIGFDDETTTAISDYSEQTVQDTPSVYNLRGQRVVQPQKGLYIVNGKKVVK